SVPLHTMIPLAPHPKSLYKNILNHDHRGCGTTMKILQEFKEFAVRGNVVDMAVGIIIGAAFSKIVSSLVNDIVMPPIGVLLGGVDFTDLSWVIKDATAEASAVSINYGQFLQNVIDFTIIAFAIFVLIKFINALRQQRDAEKAAEAPAALSKQEELLT